MAHNFETRRRRRSEWKDNTLLIKVYKCYVGKEERKYSSSWRGNTYNQRMAGNERYDRTN